MPSLLIIGWGYTAQQLARHLPPNEWRIYASSRQVSSLTATHYPHVNLIPFQSSTLLEQLRCCTHLLVTTPCDHTGADPLLAILNKQDTMQSINLDWLGYLSSTGVYGDYQGAWVDESSPLSSTQGRGHARQQVEQAWQSFAKQFEFPLHIFRLAGIYGPERNAIERVLQGQSYCITKANQVFSRIHVVDIARALTLSMQHPTPNRIYNLADDLPSPPEDVYDFACQLLGRPALPRIHHDAEEVSATTRQFFQACRKVDNRAFKNQLSFHYQYPTYQQGLTACFSDLVS